jgi:hypothetical protein
MWILNWLLWGDGQVRARLSVLAGRRVRGGAFRVEGQGQRSSGWWWQGQRCAEAGGEKIGPGPGFRDLDLAFALASDDAGGGVQYPIAQGFGFGFGEWPVEAGQAEPGEQVDGDTLTL